MQCARLHAGRIADGQPIARDHVRRRAVGDDSSPHTHRAREQRLSTGSSSWDTTATVAPLRTKRWILVSGVQGPRNTRIRGDYAAPYGVAIESCGTCSQPVRGRATAALGGGRVGTRST